MSIYRKQSICVVSDAILKINIINDAMIIVVEELLINENSKVNNSIV